MGGWVWHLAEAMDIFVARRRETWLRSKEKRERRRGGGKGFDGGGKFFSSVWRERKIPAAVITISLHGEKDVFLLLLLDPSWDFIPPLLLLLGEEGGGETG